MKYDFEKILDYVSYHHEFKPVTKHINENIKRVKITLKSEEVIEYCVSSCYISYHLNFISLNDCFLPDSEYITAELFLHSTYLIIMYADDCKSIRKELIKDIRFN